MHAMQDMPISFPGLFGDWSFNPDPKLLDIGNGVYWYGVIITVGVLLALLFCAKQAPKYGITEDNLYEFFIWALPLSLIGARLYYVIFYLDLYKTADGGLDWGKVIAIWDGGAAIYGAIIVAAITLVIFCKIKKLSIGAMLDVCVMGLFIGQAIGRWGNFFNREAFGTETDLPWRMGLWLSSTQYVEVHPTFLYESLWNVLGLILVYFVVSKLRSFDGENACFYFGWYAFGRFWIEGLRTDSLYLFDWTIGGQPIRVSQALSLVIFVASVIYLAVRRSRHPDPANLFVTRRLMAEATAKSEQFLKDQEAEARDAALLKAIGEAAEEAEAEMASDTDSTPADTVTGETPEDAAASTDPAAAGNNATPDTDAGEEKK